jgi:hypothetical protein
MGLFFKKNTVRQLQKRRAKIQARHDEEQYRMRLAVAQYNTVKEEIVAFETRWGDVLKLVEDK